MAKNLSKEPGAQCLGGCLFLPQDASGLAAKSIAVRLGADKSEANVVVPVVRVVVVPVRGTDVRSRIVPVPAAFHAVRPRRRAHAIQYCGNSGIAQAGDALLPTLSGGPLHTRYKFRFSAYALFPLFGFCTVFLFFAVNRYRTA
jgi:hypothetical protein